MRCMSVAKDEHSGVYTERPVNMQRSAALQGRYGGTEGQRPFNICHGGRRDTISTPELWLGSGKSCIRQITVASPLVTTHRLCML